MRAAVDGDPSVVCVPGRDGDGDHLADAAGASLTIYRPITFWDEAQMPGAIFSPCGRYRYSLTRRFLTGEGAVVFCMLNPSTADHQVNDPTVQRCCNFAKAWGFATLHVVNIFALRATDPKVMKAEANPISDPAEAFANDHAIMRLSQGARLTVCAWGTHGDHRERGALVALARVERPHYLKLTKSGAPGHPLYLRADLEPRPWTVTQRVGYAGRGRPGG